MNKMANPAVLRKNISISRSYVEKLEPFLEKNNGNLSAAIRDTIEIAALVLNNRADSGKCLEGYAQKKPEYAEIRNQVVEEGEFVLVPCKTLEWLIKNNSGLLLDESVVYELIDPYKFRTMPEILDYFNRLFESLGWRVQVTAEYDSGTIPGAVSLTFSNGNPYFREILAQVVVLFLIKQMKLDVDKVYGRSNLLKVYLKKAEYLDSAVFPLGFKEHFGPMDSTFREVRKKPRFWKDLIQLYRDQAYQRVNLEKNLFEALVAGKPPEVAELIRTFELLVGKPPQVFTLAEHLLIFRELYLTEKIGSSLEISTEKGREYVKIIHDYSDEMVIYTITLLYSNYFKATGYPFIISSSNNLLTFDFGTSAKSPE